MLSQVNVTTTRIKALENDVNISQAALNAQTKKIDYLKQAFDKETTNRHQLQLEYNDMKAELQNLSGNIEKQMNSMRSEI